MTPPISWWWCVVLSIIGTSSAVCAISVVSTYDNTFLLANGQTSTQRTATIVATELDNTGSLTIGDYNLAINVVSPRYNFVLNEIARGPSSVTQHVNVVCSVPSVDAFNTLQADIVNDLENVAVAPGRRRLLAQTPALDNSKRWWTPKPLAGSFASSSSSPPAPPSSTRTMRKPKFLIEGIALATSVVALLRVDYALEKINAVEEQQEVMRNKLNNLTEFAIGTRDALNALGGAFNTTAEILTQTNERVDKLTIGLNNTVQVIQLLREQTDERFSIIDQQLLQTQEDTAAAIATVGAQATQNTLNVLYQMQNFSAQYQVDQLGVINQIEQLNEQVVGLASQIFDAPSRTLVRRALTQLYFADVTALTGNRQPFVSDAGIAPQSIHGAPLQGIQSRLALDVIALNYVAIGTPGVYGIHNVAFNWFLSSDYAIDHATTIPQSIHSFFKMIGLSKNCTRPYPPGADPNGNSVCAMWIEIVDASCTTALPFDWTNTTNNPGQNTTILTSKWCQSSVISTTTVIKSFEDLFNYVETLCMIPKTTLSQLSSTRLLAGGAIASAPTLCQLTYSDMITAAGTSATQASLVLFLTTLAYTSYGQIDDDIAELETVKYGRLPAGLDIQAEPFVVVPTRYTASGEAIYDGAAAPVECLKSIWLDTTADTLPIMRISAFLPLTTLNVFATLTNAGAPCQDQGLCYAVGQQNVTNHILSSIDAPNIIPSELLVVGDLRDYPTTRRIYDLPSRLITASPSVAARQNAYPYQIMAPNTQQTLSLNEWIAYYGNYDPTVGAVSPDDFSLPAAFDELGFPYCAPFLPDVQNISSILAPASYTLINASTRCISGYVWTDALIPVTSTCLTPLGLIPLPNDGSDYSLDLSPTQWAALLVAGSVSFWYQKDGRNYDNGQFSVFALTGNSGTDVWLFSVNAFGIPTVTRSVSGTVVFDSTFLFSPHLNDLRDGSMHLVTWGFVSGAGSLNIIVYVDAMLEVEESGLPLSPALPASYTPNVTTSNANTQSAFTVVTGITVTDASVVLNSTQVQQLYLCQQSSLLPRCSVASSEVLLSSLVQNTTLSAAGVTSVGDYRKCSDSALTLYSSAIEASVKGGGFRDQALLPSDWLNETPEFAITFWLRQAAFGSSQQTVFVLTNELTSIQVQESADLFIVTVNSAVLQVSVVDDESHFVYVYVNATSAELWMDSILVSVQPQVSLGSYSTVLAFTSDRIFNVRYYSQTYGGSGVLGGYTTSFGVLTDGATRRQAINIEMNCQVNVLSSRGISKDGAYLTPVGFCVTTSTSSMFAYCRTPQMIHYSALSILDIPSGTFAPTTTLACDVGWSAPDCVTPCPRTDPVSGECIIYGDDSAVEGRHATGLIPDGEFCTVLKFFKVAVNSAGTMLTLEPRQWTVQATVSIPLGMIVQNAATTNECPSVIINQLQTGQLQLVFSNTASIDLYLQVKIAPQPVIDGTAPCLQPCCTLFAPVVIVIGAHGAGSVIIPTCGAMVILYGIQVDPAQPTNILACGEVSGASLQAALAASTSSLPTNVISTFAQVVADTSVAFRAQQVAFLTNQYYLQLQINSSNTAFLMALAQQIATLEQQELISVNFTQIPRLNYTTSNSQIDAILNATLALIAGSAAQGAEIAALNAGLAQFLAQYNAQLAVLNNISLTFLNSTPSAHDAACASSVTSLINCVTDVAKAAVNAGTGFVSDLVNSAFGIGSVSSFIAGIITFLIYAAIVVGVLVGCYYLYICIRATQKAREVASGKKSDGSKPDVATRPLLGVQSAATGDSGMFYEPYPPVSSYHPAGFYNPGAPHMINRHYPGQYA